MKTAIASNWRPLLRACYLFLIAIAALGAMPKNGRAQVYVTQLPSFPSSVIGVVSEFPINTDLITGLSVPVGLALRGNTLFVAIQGIQTVGKYDATTGGVINPSFITGLSLPVGLALGVNILFVANAGNGTVGEYDATTGEAINGSLITGLNAPEGLALLGNELFVTDSASGTVGKYDATSGAAIKANFIRGLNQPVGLAVKSAK